MKMVYTRNMALVSRLPVPNETKTKPHQTPKRNGADIMIATLFWAV
jgi:hypothetical protein